MHQTFSFFLDKRTYLAPITGDNIIAGGKTDERKKMGNGNAIEIELTYYCLLPTFIIIPRLAINKQSLFLSRGE